MININLIGNSDKNNIEEGLRRKEKGIFSKINSSKFSNIISGIIGIGMGIGVFSGCSEDKKEPSKIKKPVKVENTFISMPNEKGIEFDKIIFDKIKQGREILNQKKAGFELENYKEKKIIKKRLKTYNSLLVVYNLKSKEIKTILFEGFKHDVDNQNKSKDGFKVFFEKSNGANTDFKVEIPEGWVTIGLKRVLPFGKENPKFIEIVYTPYSEKFDIQEIRQEGLLYMLNSLIQVREELNKGNIKSKAFLNNIIDSQQFFDMTFLLGMIEHEDPIEAYPCIVHEFRNSNGKKFTKIEKDLNNKAKSTTTQLINKILTTIGINKYFSYQFGPSKAGARGLFQFMNDTYNSVKGQYPEASLIDDFIEGTDNHINAAKASVLLQDSNLSILSKKHRELLTKSENYSKLGIYLAISYNWGAGKKKSGIIIDHLFNTKNLKSQDLPWLPDESIIYGRKYIELTKVNSHIEKEINKLSGSNMKFSFPKYDPDTDKFVQMLEDKYLSKEAADKWLKEMKEKENKAKSTKKVVKKSTKKSDKKINKLNPKKGLKDNNSKKLKNIKKPNKPNKTVSKTGKKKKLNNK